MQKERIIKSEEGFINLVEAIMKQAYEDAEQTKDAKLAEEAKAYIERMKKLYGN